MTCGSLITAVETHSKISLMQMEIWLRTSIPLLDILS